MRRRNHATIANLKRWQRIERLLKKIKGKPALERVRREGHNLKRLQREVERLLKKSRKAEAKLRKKGKKR